MNVTEASLPHAIESDDIKSLTQHLPDGRLRYVNISAVQAHERALKRWPLLAELHDAQPDTESAVHITPKSEAVP